MRVFPSFIRKLAAGYPMTAFQSLSNEAHGELRDSPADLISNGLWP